MAEERAGHRAGGSDGTERARRRDEQEQGGARFDDTEEGDDPAPDAERRRGARERGNVGTLANCCAPSAAKTNLGIAPTIMIPAATSVAPIKAMRARDCVCVSVIVIVPMVLPPCVDGNGRSSTVIPCYDAPGKRSRS